MGGFGSRGGLALNRGRQPKAPARLDDDSQEPAFVDLRGNQANEQSGAAPAPK